MVATKKQLALRHALLGDHREPIARTAKARLPHTPEMQPLRMPEEKPTPPNLAADANATGASRAACDQSMHANRSFSVASSSDGLAR
jgi:hypothetical protein